MRAGALLLAAGLLPAPAAAQEPPAAPGFLAAFRDRCEAVAADPRAAVNALLDAQGDATGAMTADGALAYVTEVVETGGGHQSFTFHRIVLPGGTETSCSQTLFSFEADGLVLPGLAEVLDAAAPALLGGPARRAGGSVLAGGRVGRMLLWHRDGFPPPAALSLTQDGRSVTVTLARTIPNPPP